MTDFLASLRHRFSSRSNGIAGAGGLTITMLEVGLAAVVTIIGLAMLHHAAALSLWRHPGLDAYVHWGVVHHQSAADLRRLFVDAGFGRAILDAGLACIFTAIGLAFLVTGLEGLVRAGRRLAGKIGGLKS